MRIELRYVTRFDYPTEVWESQNALRACPRSDDHQTLVDYRLQVDPPARVASFTDRWGTQVDCFGVREPHGHLEVTVDAAVLTNPRPRPDESPSLETLRDDRYREDHWMFLQPTRHTSWGPELAELGRSTTAGALGVVEAVTAVTHRVHSSVRYVPGSTTVGVDVNQVWADRGGVCQDFAHLAIALLRSAGIAARYVSGYFYAADPSTGVAPRDEVISVQTHAWVEAAVPGWGWWAIDPTNDLEVGERHVTIGHGRDYDDVTPLRGVYYGHSEHLLAAQVWMGTDRLDRSSLPRLIPQQ